MEIKEKARERMELRIHAQDTMKFALDWIRMVKPSEWLPNGKDQIVSDDEVKALWRDFVERAGKLIDKSWKSVELVIEDVNALMEEVCAKSKITPESK